MTPAPGRTGDFCLGVSAVEAAATVVAEVVGAVEAAANLDLDIFQCRGRMKSRGSLVGGTAELMFQSKA